jgi:hypothetical protein
MRSSATRISGVTRRLGLCCCAAVALALAAPAAAGSPALYQQNAPAQAGAGAAQLSPDVRRIYGWIQKSGDNLDLPFVIVDKIGARVWAFDRHGAVQGTAAALIGLGVGDVSPAGIGQRKLADIAPLERITPAGRFIAGLGNDLGQAEILWVDYDSALSLHRVIVGNRLDRRAQRLASPGTADNRISYGCINVPADFFDQVIAPLFKQTNGVVYILPETAQLSGLFDLARPAMAQKGF